VNEKSMNQTKKTSMKLNHWTTALAMAGVISAGSVAFAEEAQQHQVLTALSSTTLSGYVATSAIWKFGTGNANMPGRTADGAGKQDGFNLDAINITLEKAVDAGQWGAGYKLDILAGPDAGTYTAVAAGGAAPGGFAGGAGAAIKQAYVDLRAPVGNGLDFKIGVWDNLLGYEVYHEGNNPNFSRSYGFGIEPLQHTGLLASYTAADWLSFSAGVADTLYGAINGRAFRATPYGIVPAAESEKSYLGMFTLTAPESFGVFKGATLSGVIDYGLNGPVAPTASRLAQYYIGLTTPTPLKGLAAGVAYDYRGTKQNDAFLVPAGATYANAVSLYLSYQATEKLKLNNRAEYASGTSGTFTGTAPPGGEEFFGETFTVDYSLWANVMSRVEFRWDHYMKGGPGVFGATYPNTGFPRDKNAVSLALNLIYKF